MLRVDTDQSEPRSTAAYPKGERAGKRCAVEGGDGAGKIDVVAAHEIRVRAPRKNIVVPKDGAAKEGVEIGRGRARAHRSPGKSSAASAAYVTMPTAVERLMLRTLPSRIGM